MPSVRNVFTLKVLSKALKPSSKTVRTLIISEPTLVECQRVFPDGTPYPYEWTRKHYLEQDERDKAFAYSQRLIAESKARAKASAPNLPVWKGNDGWRFQQRRPVRHLREAASWEEGQVEEEEEEDLAAYGAWVVPSDEEEVAVQKQGERVWWA